MTFNSALKAYLEEPNFRFLSKWMSWKCKFVKEITRFANEATLHIFCHDFEWFSQWFSKLEDTLRDVPGYDETISDPCLMDSDHPLWKEAWDGSEFIKDLEIKRMKNISTKTKKVAKYCFETQEGWEKIWEKEALEKLKADLNKTPLPKGKRHD